MNWEKIVIVIVALAFGYHLGQRGERLWGEAEIPATQTEIQASALYEAIQRGGFNPSSLPAGCVMDRMEPSRPWVPANVFVSCTDDTPGARLIVGNNFCVFPLG